MKRYLTTMVTGFALSVAICSLAISADEQKALEGELKVGGTWMLEDLDEPSITDEALRDKTSASSFSVGKAPGAKGAAEYMDIADKESSVFTGADLNFRNKNFDFDFSGRYESSRDQDYYLKGAASRIFLFETDYSIFKHRLDHDYMENLNAHIFRAGPSTAANNGDPVGLPFAPGSAGAANNAAFYTAFPDKDPNTAGYQNGMSTLGAANVYNTDWDVAGRYYANRSEWNNNMKVNIPALPGLKFAFDHRQERRSGCKQAQTMSKCSACHIESYSKSINETTNDYIPKVSFQAEALNVEYSFLHRDFEDSSQEMMNGYNSMAEAHVPGFSPLLQFPAYSNNTLVSGSEVLPFSRTPDSTKDSHNMRLRYDIDAHNTITGGMVYSKTTNTQTDGGVAGLFSNQLVGLYGDDLELESTALMAKWNSRLTKVLNLTVHGKYQTLNNDNVAIDVNDGRTLGKYTNEPYSTLDFTRTSGYDLDILSAGFDLAWRAMHGMTVSGGYEFHQEDRQNYEHHDVPETTQEHTFKLKGDWRVNKKVNLGLGYKLQLTDDPYALYGAICPPDAGFATYAGPATAGTDYNRTYEPNIYAARQATRSNQAETAHEFTLKGSFTPMQMLTSNLYGKYRYAENSDLGGSDWTQDLFTAGLNVVATPSQKVTLTAGYNYFYDTYESMYCVAIYDG